MKNWLQTTLAQWQNSEELISLLSAIDNWIDPSTNFENFYNLLWNLDTAEGYGLDVWGRILVISRTVEVPSFAFFGFQEAGDRVGFGQGPFWSGEELTQNYQLTDAVYRSLLFAKAAYNITDGSVQAINAIMMNLFPGRGNAYVIDGGAVVSGPTFGFQEAGDRVGFGQGPFFDLSGAGQALMTLTYVFTFDLQPYEKAIVQSGVLPRPAGVLAQYSFVN